MIEANDLLSKWAVEKLEYDKFGETLIEEIGKRLNEKEIISDREYRTKDDISLIKKMFRKNKSYEDIHDKVGGRVIVQFFEQLKQADDIIVEYYGNRIVKRDNKADEQSDTEFGYQSIHYDISNDDGTMFCEIQLRTICQHNWSLMSHYLSYKKDSNIPLGIRREVNALSAMFEIADKQFQSIRDNIIQLENDNILTIKRFAENYFFRNLYTSYDREITEVVLGKLVEIYKNEDPILKLENFISLNNDDILYSIRKNQNNIFFTQPEIIVILERLENKKILLKTKWSEIYPIEYLEEIAELWGTTLE